MIFGSPFEIIVAQPFRAAGAAGGRPKGLRYDRPRITSCDINGLSIVFWQLTTLAPASSSDAHS